LNALRSARAKNHLPRLDVKVKTGPSVQELQLERSARYLTSKFGDHLDDARAAMKRLARSMKPRDLATRANALYEDFRPAVPAGVRGRRAVGELDLDRVAALTEQD
jgi:hypothetical protein